MTDSLLNKNVPFILKGMCIKTNRGDILVEDVKENDTLIIRNFSNRVKKVFSEKIICDENNIPTVIKKDFFEENIPNKDTFFMSKHPNHVHMICNNCDTNFIGKEIEYYNFIVEPLDNFIDRTNNFMCNNLECFSYY